LAVDAAWGAVTGAVVVAAAAVAVVVGVGCSLADWQPASKITASAGISDPHDQKVRRLTWFIYFLLFGVYGCFSKCCSGGGSATSEKCATAGFIAGTLRCGRKRFAGTIEGRLRMERTVLSLGRPVAGWNCRKYAAKLADALDCA